MYLTCLCGAMGAALSSFGASLRATFTQPKYLALVAMSAVAYFVLAGATSFIPVVGQLVFFLVVVPALILPAITSWNISTPRGVENPHVIIAGSMNAGIIGIAYAVNEHGTAPVSAYTDSIKENVLILPDRST
jgi:hypothetical protein